MTLVSAQGLRRRGRAIAQAERESAQGGMEQQGKRVRVAWVRRVRRRTTGQRATAGEGEGEGVDEGVDAAGEQGEARRRGAPLAGTANSSPVETPSGVRAVRLPRVVASNQLTNERTPRESGADPRVSVEAIVVCHASETTSK